MKNLIAIFVLISSAQVYASCPSLTGSYSCKEGSHVTIKEIVNTDNGYSITSDGVEFNYVADGKTYDVESNDSMKDGKVSSYCKANKFVVDFKVTILYEGAEIAKQSSITEYLQVGNDLVITQKTKMKGIPLPAIKFSCKRF